MTTSPGNAQILLALDKIILMKDRNERFSADSLSPDIFSKDVIKASLITLSLFEKKKKKKKNMHHFCADLLKHTIILHKETYFSSFFWGEDIQMLCYFILTLNQRNLFILVMKRNTFQKIYS